MNKSTIVIIFVVYIASIIAIGFFGMAIKVYDKIKYVKSIEIKIEAESHNFYDFTAIEKDSKGNNAYNLIVHFNYAQIDPITNKKYLPLSILPYVEYDSGDIASEEETLVYSINSSSDLEELGYVKLESTGMLTCYQANLAFIIKVSPQKSSRNGSSAIINVYVIN